MIEVDDWHLGDFAGPLIAGVAGFAESAWIDVGVDIYFGGFAVVIGGVNGDELLKANVEGLGVCLEMSEMKYIWDFV